MAPGNNSTAKVALKLQGKPTRKWTKIENSQVWMERGEVNNFEPVFVILGCSMMGAWPIL